MDLHTFYHSTSLLWHYMGIMWKYLAWTILARTEDSEGIPIYTLITKWGTKVWHKIWSAVAVITSTIFAFCVGWDTEHLCHELQHLTSTLSSLQIVALIHINTMDLLFICLGTSVTERETRLHEAPDTTSTVRYRKMWLVQILPRTDSPMNFHSSLHFTQTVA
jgi:hypothetical protein